MAKELDSDRAAETFDDDKFSFAGIAQRLTPSIVEASRGDGIVIGLEGRWGSGKTSLLNFIRAELEKVSCDNIHTIMVAPWLNGDASSLIASVLEPIAEVLERIELESASSEEQFAAQVAENARNLRRTVTHYGSKTARGFVPVADLMGYFVPGAQAASGAMNAIADLFEGASAEHQPAPTELKAQIVDKIRAMDVGFVIILDDLDRLEPAQAVEVVRLVRSVADFPKVAYLMCYDRDVLAHALKEGLKVKSGDLFLQKIVQLTFAIPLPEPFDLRTQFRNEALEFYQEIHGEELNGADLDEFLRAVDYEGLDLTTPREVKLALNSIKFTYPSIYTDVYFPDFCRLHLIKITRFKLYKWLEAYLSVRSIIASGDGVVGVDEQKRLGKELKKLFPSKKPDSPRSIWRASNYIPGIVAMEKAADTVFASTPSRDHEQSITLKRLGSPLHYRFYFALTGPKTVMPDAEFDEIIRLAREDIPGLKTSLSGYVRTTRPSRKTWFEHVLDRLDDGVIKGLSKEALIGLVTGICETMDATFETDKQPRFGFLSVARLGCTVVGQCMRQLELLDATEHHGLALWIVSKCSSINWLIADLLHDELFRHGRAGSSRESTASKDWAFSDEMLDELLKLAVKRISEEQVQASIWEMPNIRGFMFGWRAIAGEGPPRAWVEEATKDDERFVRFLTEMRSYAISDQVYYPLHRQTIELFFADADEVTQRLKDLSKGKYESEVRVVQEAIETANYF